MDRDKKFAIKNLKEKYATREIEVFKYLQRVPHPCVVGLYSVHIWPGPAGDVDKAGQDSRMVSLVMELCPGGDLFNQVKMARAQAKASKTVYAPPVRCDFWLAQTFIGLEYLHTVGTGMMFRDLKPANLILDEFDRVKLADFGVSKLGSVSDGLFTLGTPAGSPGYVAPELLRQQAYGVEVDWFSFGVLIWVLQTGGMSEFPDPQPPTNARQLKREDVKSGCYKALFEDYMLLQQVANDTDGKLAPPMLNPEAQDLVMHLATEKANRLDAPRIRDHPFLSRMKLPAPSADGAEVLGWIAENERQFA